MSRRHIKVKTWKYTDNFEFPENKYIDSNRKNMNIGIAFSGGGNRSAPLTIGYLRALHHLGLIKNIKYISSVSGGSWAVIPYIFHDKRINEATFLGEFIEPEKLKYEDLTKTNDYCFLTTISRTNLLDDFLKNIYKSDEIFANVLGNIYLKDYLLNNNEKFFSLNEESVQEIINRDGNEDLYKNEFYVTNNDKPFLIANGVLTRNTPLKGLTETVSEGGNPYSNAISRFPFEITPLYVGIPPFFNNEGSLGKFDIGGGYVEPLGFDSDSPDTGIDDNGIASVRIKKKQNIFSLLDIMAVTGAAPAEFVNNLHWKFGFPEFKYWSPKNPQPQKDYDFVDGGMLDNLGIMPLLRRKTDKIIAFVNGAKPFDNRYKKECEMSKMVETLFKKVDGYFGKRNYEWNIVLKEKNIEGEESFDNLCESFKDLSKNNKFLVVKKKYVTVTNDRFDIKEGHPVEILWVYNTFSDGWLDKINILDKELSDYINKQKDSLNFPNYSTFFPNRTGIIDINIKQANLMAHYASHIVDIMKSEFSDFLS